MSNAFFSNPDGLLERKDGTMNNHHHQNPRTWIDTSLYKLWFVVGVGLVS
jgi:hypothetical protein